MLRDGVIERHNAQVLTSRNTEGLAAQVRKRVEGTWLLSLFPKLVENLKLILNLQLKAKRARVIARQKASMGETRP